MAVSGSAAGDGVDVVAVVLWMVVGRETLLIVDDAKLSVGICQCSIWPWPSQNSTYPLVVTTFYDKNQTSAQS